MDLIGLDGGQSSVEQINYATHAQIDYERATCEEIQCDGFRDGWVTALPLDDSRSDYIRRHSGRRFAEYSSEGWNERGRALSLARNEVYDDVPPGLAVFHFSPGQPCFQAANHQKPVASNPLFLVRDHAGAVLRRHSGVDPFLDDFRGHSEPQFDILRDRMGESNG